MLYKFIQFLKDEEMTDVFSVNLPSSINIHLHCLLCDMIAMEEGTVIGENYIEMVVIYRDGSFYDELNKKWLKICKNEQLDCTRKE